MVITALMIAAGMLLGCLLPEWLLVLSPSQQKVPLPWMHNILSAIAFGIIFGFIAS